MFRRDDVAACHRYVAECLAVARAEGCPARQSVVGRSGPPRLVGLLGTRCWPTGAPATGDTGFAQWGDRPQGPRGLATPISDVLKDSPACWRLASDDLNGNVANIRSCPASG